MGGVLFIAAVSTSASMGSPLALPIFLAFLASLDASASVPFAAEEHAAANFVAALAATAALAGNFVD